MSRRRDNVVPFRKPFKAVPLHRVVNRPAQRRKARGITPLMIVLPLAAFAAVFMFGLPGVPSSLGFRAPQGAATDRETAYFDLCEGPVRVNCVVDGDTFWYGGEKIRIADINAPEVSEPDCVSEAALAQASHQSPAGAAQPGPLHARTRRPRPRRLRPPAAHRHPRRRERRRDAGGRRAGRGVEGVSRELVLRA